MSYQADPRVDTYISGLPEWQQRICQEVREVVHEADAEVEETIKRTVLPYFVLAGTSRRSRRRRTTSTSSCTTRS